MHGKGAMHVGETATEVGSTHPTGMHSCLSMRLFIWCDCDAFVCVMSYMDGCLTHSVRL